MESGRLLVRNGNWFVTFSFFTTRGLDFAGFKFIWAQLKRRSRPWRIRLQPGTDVIVTVRSSINALIGGCRISELVSWPLHSTSADFTNISIAKANNITEIACTVIMPFLSRWNVDATVPEVTLKLKQL